MPIEPIIGFVMCGVLALLIRVYLRFSREASPHPEFERWIASRPLVAAFKVDDARSIDVEYAVRALLGPGTFVNSDGGYPWQHYLVRYECRRVSTSVVGLFAIEASLARERDAAPNFRDLLREVGVRLADDVEELWLDGRLRSPGIGSVADRRKMSWFGAFDDEGALDLTAMIGHPAWVEPRAA